MGEGGLVPPEITMWQWIRFGFYVVTGLVSIWYGFFVRSAGAGNTFYRIWFVLGIILLGLAAAVQFRLWTRIPVWLRIAFVTVVCFGLLWYIVLMTIIATRFSADEAKVSYIIVLGAQMREDGPSVVLKYRLETAEQYLKDHPEVICIVSGGRGSNETVSEAEGMRDYLVSHGIEKSRIVMEDQSTDTSENLKNCLALLPSADTPVGIVTNNFHMYRAMGIAIKCGYGDVSAIPARSTKAYLPHNLTREVIGVLKDVLMGNMKLY